MAILIAIIVVLIILILLGGFHFGPYVLDWFFDKVDEWVEIIGSLEDEK